MSRRTALGMANAKNLVPALLSALLFAGLAAREARFDGPTVDEPTYILAASRMGDGVDPGNEEHPFLGKAMFLGAQELFSPRPAAEDVDAWLLGGGLGSSRAVSVLLGALLCAVISVVASARGLTAGFGAGLAAATTPEWLAHGHLATLDMPVTLFFCAACVAADGYLRKPVWSRLVWLGAAVTAAILTKWSALMLLPALPLAAFAGFPGRWRERLRAALPVAAACALAAGASVALHAATFGLPALYRGLAFQLQHAENGHAALFMGRMRWKGTPAFYAVGLVLATPLALWPLAVLGRSGIARRTALWLPPLLLVVVLSFAKVQLGLRYVLPIYLPLLVAAGAGIAVLLERRRAWLAIGLVAAFAVSSLAYEAHLGYRNELRFFSRWRGLDWLPESDGDWGQGAPALSADVERLGIRTLCIAWIPGIAESWRRIPTLRDRVRDPGECEAGAVGGFLLFAEKRFAPLKDRRPLNPGQTVLLFDLRGAPELAAAWQPPPPPAR
jgi:hypothetical protein